MVELFRNRNLLLLFIGELISSLGDQLSAVALPWLVLALTNDSVAMGMVVACATIPRALLLLFGGAIVDRMSPRKVLVRTRLLDAVIVAALAACVFSGRAEIWMVYVVAFAGGLVAAFSMPAASAMVPRLVLGPQLQSANALIMAVTQATTLVGPALGGAVIAAFSTSDFIPRTAANPGLGLAFLLDGFSFAASALVLARISLSAPAGGNTANTILEDLRQTVMALSGDRELRTLVLYFSAIALLVSGPVQVALPFYVDQRLQGTTATLGLLMSSLAFGALLGMGASVATAGPRPWRLGVVLLFCDAASGASLLAFGHVTSTWQACALLAGIGALGGFVQAALLTWLQRRVPESMLGRATSLFMLIMFAVVTVGALVAGMALRAFPLPRIFDVMGFSLVGIVAVAFAFSAIPRIYANR